jgi:hypothetical protein
LELVIHGNRFPVNVWEITSEFWAAHGKIAALDGLTRLL